MRRFSLALALVTALVAATVTIGHPASASGPDADLCDVGPDGSNASACEA